MKVKNAKLFIDLAYSICIFCTVMFIGQGLFFIVPETIAYYILNVVGIALVLFWNFIFFSLHGARIQEGYHCLIAMTTTISLVCSINYFFSVKLQTPFLEVLFCTALIAVGIYMVAHLSFAVGVMSGFWKRH